jgi:hypothetical protein
VAGVAIKPPASVFLDADATIGSLLVDGSVPELLFLLRVGPARAEAAVMAAFAKLAEIAVTCEQRGRMWHLLRTLFIPASEISKVETKRGQAKLAKQLAEWSPDRVAYQLVGCTEKPRSQTRMALHCDFGIFNEDTIVRLALAHVATACAPAKPSSWSIGLTFRAHESASPDCLACIPSSEIVQQLFASQESTTVTFPSQVCAFWVLFVVSVPVRHTRTCAYLQVALDKAIQKVTAPLKGAPAPAADGAAQFAFVVEAKCITDGSKLLESPKPAWVRQLVQQITLAGMLF